MKTECIHKPSVTIAGCTLRTSLNDEMNPETAQLGAAWGNFHQENMISKIPNITEDLCGLYINYDDKKHLGSYDCCIGAFVENSENLSEEFNSFTLPESNYLVFTTDPGEMPFVLIEAWKYIWAYFDKDDCAYKRTYTGDFEVYDKNAQHHPENAVIKIYIAIK